MASEKLRDAFKWATRTAIFPLSRRNAFVDALFYDASALTAAEQAELGALENPEGSIVVVWPAAVGKPIRRYPRVPEFLRRHGAALHGSDPRAPNPDAVQAVAVAGVGSSALGTAALARAVADVIGEPVAGVVSGYGLLDVVSEGLGGYFVLGFDNELSRIGEEAVTAVAPFLERALKGWHAAKLADPDLYVPGHPDSSALADVLGSGETAVRYVVGHSKGSLSMWNALEKLDHALPRLAAPRRGAVRAQLATLQFITLGAPAFIDPDLLKNLGIAAEHYRQFLGKLDVLGGLNRHTRFNDGYTRVAGAGHHLSRLPGAMPLREILESVRAASAAGGGTPNPAPTSTISSELPTLGMFVEALRSLPLTTSSPAFAAAWAATAGRALSAAASLART